MRFSTKDEADLAMQELDNGELGGSMIALEVDASVAEGTKLIVHGVPDTVQNQDLKDYFAAAGTVKFAKVRPLTPEELAEWAAAEAAAAAWTE